MLIALALPSDVPLSQAATKLRQFFLSLLAPIRTSMSTNLSVIQTSVFLKYRSLFAFLQRQAPSVANEIQRAYVGAARTYFETGFRRYIRSLNWIKASTRLVGVTACYRSQCACELGSHHRED